MKILTVSSLALEGIKAIRFARFHDRRGYFTEPYRESDIARHPETSFLRGVNFVQVNESYSFPSVVRGLHFQWNPYMGKLVRTCSGRMVDLFLDIRQSSPTYGKIAAHDMPANPSDSQGEWIWVPPGFAHGNYFTEPTRIEYMCTAEYSPGCEACISPLAEDIDWTLCDTRLRIEYRSLIASPGLIITEKDAQGLTVSDWTRDERSGLFRHLDLRESPSS